MESSTKGYYAQKIRRAILVGSKGEDSGKKDQQGPNPLGTENLERSISLYLAQRQQQSEDKGTDCPWTVDIRQNFKCSSTFFFQANY